MKNFLSVTERLETVRTWRQALTGMFDKFPFSRRFVWLTNSYNYLTLFSSLIHISQKLTLFGTMERSCYKRSWQNIFWRLFHFKGNDIFILWSSFSIVLVFLYSEMWEKNCIYHLYKEATEDSCIFLRRVCLNWDF